MAFIFCRQNIPVRFPVRQRNGGDRDAALEKLADQRAGTVDQLFIIVIGEEGMGKADLDPADAGDFPFLRNEIIIPGMSKKINDILHNVPAGRIGNDLPEARAEIDQYAGLFKDLASGGLLFGFSCFNVSFWKGPVSSGGVFDQQKFGIPVVFAKNDRTAGLFILHSLTSQAQPPPLRRA